MGVEESAVAAQAAHAADEPVVRLEGVQKRFGDNLVLDGIDLTVARRDVLVVIGPSGSGKSTLLRCINLLEPIQEGRIFFEGDEITRKGTKASAIRQRIGIVFQQFNLFPHLRTLNNVTLAARRVKKEPRRKAEERGRELSQGRPGDKADSYRTSFRRPAQRSRSRARDDGADLMLFDGSRPPSIRSLSARCSS